MSECYKSITSVQQRRLSCTYKVITLCGSTKFKTEFLDIQKKLTLEGNIVISVGLFGHSGDNEVWEGKGDGSLTETKIMLDDMHKAKISLSDEIFVINKDGYIGESTLSEIKYAESLGIPVKYLEPLKLLDRNPDSTFKKGEVVKHFKRELLSDEDKKNTSKYLYIIENTAIHTESEETLVIYRAVSDENEVYARPASEFYGLVDKEKYPNIKQKYRFEEYIKD